MNFHNSSMYPNNKPPKILNNVGSQKTGYVVPSHIFKLINKLKEVDDKSNISKTLKLFSYIIRYDEVMKDIFLNFGWEENSKKFHREVSYKELIEKLEHVYDIKVEDVCIKEENMNSNLSIINSIGI